MDRALLHTLATGFPSLTFDAQLRLVSLNDVARKLFQFPSDIALDTFCATFFFTASRDVRADRQGDLEKRWRQIIEEGTQNWENGLSRIEYWTQEEGVRLKHSCEGIITSTDAKTNGIISNGNSQRYSITLIRPSPPPQPIPHPPPLVHTTTPRYPSKHSIRHDARGDSEADTEDSPINSGDAVTEGSSPGQNTTFASIFESMSVLRKEGSKGLSRAKLQETIDHLPQIAFTATAAGLLTSFNKRWYDFTGLKWAESLDPKIWLTLWHPDDVGAAVDAWMISLATGNTFNVEYRILSREKEWVHVVARGNPVRNEEGEIESWVCTITEVGELVQARENVTAILRGANLVLFSVQAGQITFFEGALLNPLNPDESRKPSSWVGTDLKTAWNDPVLHLAVEDLSKTNHSLDAPAHLQVDSSGLGPEADRTIRYQLVTAGKTIIVVAADISIQIAATLEMLELEAKALAAKERELLKTQFVTTISHEIRTPICVVISIIELLLEDRTLTDDQRSLLEKSLRSSEILLDLVGMVLDMGKVEAGLLEIEHLPFKLEQTIADAALFSIPISRKGLEYDESISPYFPGTLLGDSNRLRQVLSNLISNAIKFTKKGKITFKLEQTEDDNQEIAVAFSIIDTGMGIRESVIPYLFSPFHQADSSTSRLHGGSGLGLYISKSLVELMGGTIELESTVGEGTCMTVRLRFVKLSETPVATPLTKSTITEGLDPASVDACDAPRARNPANYHILLAEDNALIRDIITRTLTKMKFRVSTASDGVETVKMVENDHFDLILMDQQMPFLSGFEAALALRKSEVRRIREIKIIALTASVQVGDREKCLAAGMNSYLSKPVRASDLEAAIWEQLEPTVRMEED